MSFFNYIILPTWIYLNDIFMPNKKNWLYTLLDIVWEKILGTLWTYLIETPYLFIKEKFTIIINNIFYFLLPKNYIDNKEKSAISFFKDSWHHSLSKTISIKFWAYFITGIVIFGGIGVWIEVIDLIIEKLKFPNGTLDFSKLNGALLFYITTLLGGISSQVFLDDDIPKNIKSGSWILIILVYFFTAGIAYTQSEYPDKSYSYFILCLVLTMVSLSIAWLINAFNKTLDEPMMNTAPLGGENFGIGRQFSTSGDDITATQEDPLKTDLTGLKDY